MEATLRKEKRDKLALGRSRSSKIKSLGQTIKPPLKSNQKYAQLSQLLVIAIGLFFFASRMSNGSNAQVQSPSCVFHRFSNSSSVGCPFLLNQLTCFSCYTSLQIHECNPNAYVAISMLHISQFASSNGAPSSLLQS